MRTVIAATAVLAALMLAAAIRGWPLWILGLLMAATLLCGLGAPAVRERRRQQPGREQPPAGPGEGA